MISPMVSRILRITLALTTLTLLAVASASATVFTSVTQSGTFTSDDQNVQYTFTVPTAQTLYFYTTSYAGGLNANGTTAPEGGFDPYLALYKNDTVTDSNGTHHGTFLNANDDSTDGGGGQYYNRPDAKTGATFDSYLSTLDTQGNAVSPGIALAAGSYILAVTEFDNLAAGYLSDGFLEDGNNFPNGDFTESFGPAGATGAFYDTSNIPGAQRNGNYTFNISATAPTVGPAAPEPAQTAALGLFGLALGGLILTARRRAAAAK